MLRNVATGLLILAGIFGIPGHAWSGDSGWVSASRLKTISRQARAAGEIPVSFDCRNASSNSAVIKPEIRVVTKANGAKKNWTFFASPYDFRAGPTPGHWKEWAKVDGNVLRSTGGSGKIIICALYHQRKGNTVANGTPALSRKTNQGFVTVH